MAENMSRLKSTQYLLICRAGLAVSAESEAASEELKRDMLQEFKDDVVVTKEKIRKKWTE